MTTLDPTTPEHRAKLRAIAQNIATTPWTISENGGYIEGVGIFIGRNRAGGITPVDAAHIAAFDPPTVLALLDYIDRLEQHLKIYGQVCDGLTDTILDTIGRDQLKTEGLLTADESDGDWEAIRDRCLELGDAARNLATRLDTVQAVADAQRVMGNIWCDVDDILRAVKGEQA